MAFINNSTFKKKKHQQQQNKFVLKYNDFDITLILYTL